MLLEERLNEVSNRSTNKISKEKKKQYSLEIKKALQFITDSYQEETPEELPSPDYQPDLELQEIYPLQDPFPSSYHEEPSPSFKESESSKSEEAYSSSDFEEKSAPLDNEEAQEIVHEVLLSYLLGHQNNLPPEKKEKFSIWEKLNKHLLMLYHSLNPLRTDNINYSFAF